MSKPKKVDATAAAVWVQGGHAHRPAHAAKVAASVAAAVAATPGVPGRPKAFGDGQVERLNLLLPADLVAEIRLEALERRMTPGQVVVERLTKKR